MYIIFRVDNWINNIELSKINRENFIEDIKNISQDFEADIKYRKFINNLLKGKKTVYFQLICFIKFKKFLVNP